MYSLQEVAQDLTLSPQARFLVGLYHPQVGISADQPENVRFLVGCQSVKPDGSQVHLITLEDVEDLGQSFHLRSQSFIHPNGEVVGLTAIPAAPLLFASVYSSIGQSTTETTSGARLWRLPPPNSSSSSPSMSGALSEVEERDPDFADRPAEELQLVSSLPCGDFTSVKKIAAHPSEVCLDLACVLGPPSVGSGAATTARATAGVHRGSISAGSSFLAILKTDSGGGGGGGGGAGDYRIDSCVQLCLPGGKADSRGIGCGLSTPVNAIRWSPHRNASTLAVAFDTGVLGVDTRCLQPCFWMGDIHWPRVHDLDFNPNRDNTLATAGDDGCVCVWDLRNYGSPSHQQMISQPKRGGISFRSITSDADVDSTPLITQLSHSHWVWSVRYHPTRDELLISAGSDSCVCLHSFPGISSEAERTKPRVLRGHGGVPHSAGTSPSESDLSFESLNDGLLARLDQHEESIYAVDWSPVDPWIFASVNYDGHFVVSQVPHKVKLGILLQRDDDDEETEEEMALE